MRKKNSLLMGLVSVFLAVATAACMGFAIRTMPKGILLRVGGFICAPQIAIAAQRKVLDDFFEESIQTAQTLDENDYTSGFWTQLPTEQEIIEPQNEPISEVQAPEGSAPILTAHYEQGSGDNFIQCGVATIKNCTALSSAEIEQEVMQPLAFNIEKNSSEPQILIMHTHATETYQLTNEPWCDPNFSARSTDYKINMAAVGERMTTLLNEAGINTIHDTTLHDYPSYTGSYERSAKTVKEYLKQYPSIKIVLDVHRDAIQKDDGTRIKPVAQINGKNVAQVMIICGANKNGNIPNFKQNLRFASLWQNSMETLYGGFTRPVLFDYRFYNQNLTTGSLLIEVGGHANTLEEAVLAGEFAANGLIELFKQ